MVAGLGKFWDAGSKGRHVCNKNLRLSKHTDMAIHWKALEEHFLMVFRINHFSQKNSSNTSINISEMINSE
jgi:hypothetical protein